MNTKIWKWINRIFSSGIWLQPFAMAGLIWFFKNVLQGNVSYLLLFVLSFLPTVYVWSENQRQTVAGKTEFAIEDIFHDRPTEFSSPLKMQAMYPKVDEGLLFDKPQGIVLGKTEEGIQVAIYDDRLEVTSPGGLYNGLTYEEVMNGHSKIRNKGIANIFSQMGLVEAWGSGIKRILNAAEEYRLPQPRFQEFDNMFRVELFRNSFPMTNEKENIGETSEKHRR